MPGDFQSAYQSPNLLTSFDLPIRENPELRKSFAMGS
jgi:hypothetical protein